MIWTNVILSFVWAVEVLNSFQQRKFGWMTFDLLFTALHIYLIFSKIAESRQTKQDLARMRREQERIEALFLLMNELSMGCTEEELNAVVEGIMPLVDLREELLSRKKLLWSHAHTDCRYFSGSSFLKCAVNPTVSCSLCQEFESV